MLTCLNADCTNTREPNHTLCPACILVGKQHRQNLAELQGTLPTECQGTGKRLEDGSMCLKYPKYYKAIPAGVTELDIYAVCKLFDVNDAALSHALKKIMLPGTRTGGKSRYDDIKEARDTLTRWLELNK